MNFPDSGEVVGAWIAAIAGLLALLKSVYDIYRKHRKERLEIEEALDHAPQVRHQLELGNVGEAVKYLNIIMESQAEYIRNQDQRVKACDEDIKELKQRNEALETETATWELKYREEVGARQRDRIDFERQIAALHAEIDEMKKSFERTIAELTKDRN